MRQRTNYRRRLRSRIFISFALFGLILAATFAAATVYLRARLEDNLIGETLTANLTSYSEAFYNNPETLAWPYQKVAGFVFSERKFYKVPENWRDLDDGIHDLVEVDAAGNRSVYKLAVLKDPNYWFFLKYDTTQEQQSQARLQFALIGAVAVFALLSLVIGAWLSTRVIRPLSDLARRLRRFRQVGRVTPLAPHFADDEVGELAAALDDYSNRLTRLVERDREFNSDVSHELRTPLAVIATTTELLLDSPELSAKLRERLKRIERASQQSAELIEALLLLSRAERSGPMDGETSDVAKVAADVIASQTLHLRNKPVQVRLVAEAALEVHAPSSVLSVALTNLISNAIKYTNSGEVVVRVGADTVVVEDTGKGIELEDAERLFQRGERGSGVTGSGAGLGLAIVRRLCELYGWSVSLKPRADAAGSVATINFSARVPR